VRFSFNLFNNHKNSILFVTVLIINLKLSNFPVVLLYQNESIFVILQTI
jgi:hypothetical protein